MARYDVHRHLEGSHSPQALAQLAATHDIPAFRDAGGRPLSAAELAPRVTMVGSGDWLAFYRPMEAARLAYVSTTAIRDATYLACRDAADECDGFELRFSLFSMVRALVQNTGGNIDALSDAEFRARAESVLAAVIDARARAVRDLGKPILLRAGFSRSFETPSKYAAAAEVLRAQARELSGLDILGTTRHKGRAEELDPALVAIVLDLRRDVPDLSVHAGELSGAASVTAALALEPDAIGHGIRSLEDEAVIAQLLARGITLEVCPTSNALLVREQVEGAIRRDGVHPLAALQRRRVHCALGSDDPSVFGTRFDTEWHVAARYGADLVQLERDVERRWGQLTRPGR